MKQKQIVEQFRIRGTTLVNFHCVDGSLHYFFVKSGTSVKDLLVKLNHQYLKGLVYKLNGRLLETENQELLENPLLKGRECTLEIRVAQIF